MEKKGFWKNNKGVSLIFVIGCIALLSVIGSMLLLVTANNREMKQLEKRIQDTFYQAESGSDEMASALEAMAEKALGEAFSDMLIQYSAFAGSDEREERISDYFTAALQRKLNDGATNIMAAAVGGPVSVTVDFPHGVTVEAEPPDSGKTDIIRIKGATFVYQDGAGNESKITTDICIQAEIPDVEGGMNASSGKSNFTDFVLITKGDVTMSVATGTQTATVDGNVYTGGKIEVTENAILKLQNADKVLVKKDIIVKTGKIAIDNSGKLASGYGVWADGLKIQERGTLEGKSNFYISDDLTIEGKGGKVALGGAGTEYVGFSGNTSGELSRRSSAVTINNAKDITLDFSTLENLILSGLSYIKDEKWGSGDAIMQGESLAYKDMQAMYLVPGECLATGYNPMPTEEYNKYSEGMMSLNYSYEIEEDGEKKTVNFDLTPYLDTVNPYLKRSVRLDGGATDFTYLYLNFKNEAAAVKYFNDYMATPQGDAIKKQIKNLDSATGSSEIKLAQHNYTLGSILGYTGGSLSLKAPETSGAVFRLQSTATARQRQKALFTSFRLSANGMIDADWASSDVIAKTVLNQTMVDAIPAGWTKTKFGSYDFWTYNGSAEITDIPSGTKGIILVNGDVAFKATNANFSGLVIATGGVSFGSATTLTADQEAVETLLREPEVAKYFRTGTIAEGTHGYLSSEAVEIRFENWQKN